MEGSEVKEGSAFWRRAFLVFTDGCGEVCIVPILYGEECYIMAGQINAEHTHEVPLQISTIFNKVIT